MLVAQGMFEGVEHTHLTNKQQTQNESERSYARSHPSAQVVRKKDSIVHLNPNSSPLPLAFEFVTHAPNGFDHAPRFAQGLSQTLDVHIHGSLFNENMVAPHPIQ